jgi:hypothetical protein
MTFGTLDDVWNMNDDETSEPLHQLINRHEYLTELKIYSKILSTLRPFHSPVLLTIRGSDHQSLEEIKSQILLTLCQVIAHQPKRHARQLGQAIG